MLYQGSLFISSKFQGWSLEAMRFCALALTNIVIYTTFMELMRFFFILLRTSLTS